MYILGISAYYHDSAAALLRDGEIIAAAQEERFSRKKHDEAFPAQAIDYCLREAGITAADLDHVGFYDKPLSKFERLLETYIAFAPAGYQSFCKATPEWLRQKLHLRREIVKGLRQQYRNRLIFTSHHESHAASAFYPSPFEEAAVLTIDGVGEWATATCGVGRGNRIELQREMRFPHSLGLLYSAFTYYCGFEVNGGEYKLMGLAPYGKPIYTDKIYQHLIDLKADGSFRMDMSYFNYCQGLTMTSARFDELFGEPPRQAEAELNKFYMDVAASIQRVTEEIVLRMARDLHQRTQLPNLVMAGGVALNCVANGRIQREGPFERVWVQPAAGDAGGALGVAQFIWHQLLGEPRHVQPTDSQQGSLLGPAYDNDEVQRFLDQEGAEYETHDEEALVDRAAELIADGKIVAWFQGRMEFGPRALGSRSLLGDPRCPDMQSRMNLKTKFRESFRPFAPSVLAEHADQFFDEPARDGGPYMLFTAPVQDARRRSLPGNVEQLEGIDLLKVPRSEIPAVTHVDYSARVQTVDAQRHGRYHGLLQRFHARTGCPVIVNTSFNLATEPIVNRPQEAYDSFMSSEADALVLNNIVLLKDRQRASVEAVRVSEGVVDRGLLDAWCCPACSGGLSVHETSCSCADCGRRFDHGDGIWQLFWPTDDCEQDITQKVKAFYEETPFPSYDEHDTLRSLISKARRSGFARMLGEQIPYNARVLEVGCGTGQMSNYLGVACRSVIGADMCLNSLRMAEDFRSRHTLERVRFLQMNLFRPALHDEQFDVVLCNGVLHHTPDPEAGFRRIAQLVRPGGHIIIGLYNKYGRWWTDARRVMFRIASNRLRWLDPRLREAGAAQGQAWFADQYQHPHESKHTFGEALQWLDRSGFTFVNAVPSLKDSGASETALFEPTDRGTAVDRFMAQARLVATGSREGGFFTMIGRRSDA